MNGRRRRTLPHLPLREAAARIAALHNEGGGSTLNLVAGDLAGQRAYSVSVFNERSEIIPGRAIAEARVEAFVERNLDLLQRGASIGTWYDEEDDVTWLDVVITPTAKREAVRLGKRYNQRGIYDLRTGTEISTGGTGEVVVELPVESDRIPESVRRRFGWRPSGE